METSKLGQSWIWESLEWRWLGRAWNCLRLKDPGNTRHFGEDHWEEVVRLIDNRGGDCQGSGKEVSRKAHD